MVSIALSAMPMFLGTRALLHRIPYTPVDTTLAVAEWQSWPLLGATLIAPLLVGGQVVTVPFAGVGSATAPTALMQSGKPPTPCQRWW